MKRRSSQRGIALVITLLMLAVVTLMAVVFLAISRREKSSVTVVSDLTDARLMADAGLARAQAEVASRILTTTNPFNYDLIVSTNFINPRGFRSGVASPENVGYTNSATRQALDNLTDQLQNIANLQYDPRPPVYLPTDATGTNTDFRFYLDFNRNGQYEPNGWLPVTVNGRLVTNFFVGDPEWIGILERPDRPHSESNRFIGRYAFIILPAGKSLDLNAIHNNAKLLSPNLQSDGFFRNQGFGSWEINLAAFLRDLNTNTWRTYQYRNSLLAQNTGDSFTNAATILAHRYFDSFKQNYTLDNVGLLFGPSGVAAFQADGIDNYTDGPLVLSSTGKNLDVPPDIPSRPWSGSPNPQGYYDIQELFHRDATSQDFTNRFSSLLATLPAASYYDRYTIYRLLAQMGTDSRPAESNRLYQADMRLHWVNKVHLNYRNEVYNGQTNFVPRDPVSPAGAAWASFAPGNPTNFFFQAADHILRSSLVVTNVATNFASGVIAKHFLVGPVPVRTGISLTNIQLAYFGPTNGLPYFMTNREYNATTHRLLQVAANIYDATTTRRLGGGTNDYPSVFRPTFYKTATNLIINGYVEEKSTNFLIYPWHSIDEVVADKNGDFPINREQRFLNIYGVPVVIGAKKGYPNFNEISSETAVVVSRKLEVLRRGSAFQTNQMHVIGISNIFGVEAWNSYTQSFQRPLELHVTNQYQVYLRHGVSNSARLLRFRSGTNGTTIQTNSWPGRASASSFLLPIQTNVLFLTNAAYLSRPPYLFDSRATNNFEATFDPPQWFLTITNRLQYFVIDKSVSPSRVIDFVNLENLVTDMDITSRLVGDTVSGAGGAFSDAGLTDGDLWRTNRTSTRGPTLGVLNQIAVALGDPSVGQNVWRSQLQDPVAGDDKLKAILKFREFFSAGATNLAMQVPYTPTRKLYQKSTWQVNDPLVHYMLEDLTDPVLTASSNNFMVVSPPTNPLPPSNLGLINERYEPWSGGPNHLITENLASMSIKDPSVRSSDDWDFPTNKFSNIGLLGRVHRGTPWQTIYLKAGVADPRAWFNKFGSLGTHPTNDWKLLDLFTVAPNEVAARGLLSVNQTNTAAWSAVLSGVAVLSNALPAGRFEDVIISPSSPELQRIVDGIGRMKARQTNQVFQTMGEILATPELTVASPFLNFTNLTPTQFQRSFTDAAVERIPQQVLSLLKSDEPRIVVYAFGQSLKPAERSLVTMAPQFFNICTNYQVTGEFVAKSVLRIEDAPEKPRVVMESYSILPPE
jgi:Tfp pilus assembly protein PilX